MVLFLQTSQSRQHRLCQQPALDQLLAAFDPKLHGGEVMAGGAVGVEAFAHGNATKNKAPYAGETMNEKAHRVRVGSSNYRLSAGGGKADGSCS